MLFLHATASIGDFWGRPEHMHVIKMVNLRVVPKFFALFCWMSKGYKYMIDCFLVYPVNLHTQI